MTTTDRSTRSHQRAVAVVAAVATAAFAAGALLTQLVLVPSWQSADPAQFLDRFATEGVALGGTQLPLLTASAVLLTVAAWPAWRRRDRGRLLWALACLAVLGAVLLLPVYFVSANSALLSPALPADDAHAGLATWSNWNWLRTGLGVAATVLCTWAAALTPDVPKEQI